MRAASMLAVLVVVTGCGDDKPAPPTPDEYILDCEQGVPDGGAFASDENYAAFLDKEAAGAVTQDPCKSPELTMPAAGGTLDRTTPPSFAFNATHATCRRAEAARVILAAGCRLRRQPLWRRLLGAFVLEGVAEAHCGAYTGENYLFRLVHAGESKAVYMAELSVTSFTPDQAIWQRVMNGRGGQQLQLTIERAVFFRGDIMDGPYVEPQPYTFQVAP